MDFLIISPHWSLNTTGNLLSSHIDFILSLYDIDYFMPSPIFSTLQNMSLNYWCCFVCHCALRSNEEGVSRRLYCCARCQWMSVPVPRALPSRYCFSPSSVHFSYSSKQLLKAITLTGSLLHHQLCLLIRPLSVYNRQGLLLL